MGLWSPVVICVSPVRRMQICSALVLLALVLLAQGLSVLGRTRPLAAQPTVSLFDSDEDRWAPHRKRCEAHRGRDRELLQPSELRFGPLV